MHYLTYRLRRALAGTGCLPFRRSMAQSHATSISITISIQCPPLVLMLASVSQSLLVIPVYDLLRLLNNIGIFSYRQLDEYAVHVVTTSYSDAYCVRRSLILKVYIRLSILESGKTTRRRSCCSQRSNNTSGNIPSVVNGWKSSNTPAVTSALVRGAACGNCMEIQ